VHFAHKRGKPSRRHTQKYDISVVDNTNNITLGIKGPVRKFGKKYVRCSECSASGAVRNEPLFVCVWVLVFYFVINYCSSGAVRNEPLFVCVWVLVFISSLIIAAFVSFKSMREHLFI
jgi:hypothetical protein